MYLKQDKRAYRQANVSPGRHVWTKLLEPRGKGKWRRVESDTEKKKDDKQLAMAHDPINDNVATKNIQKELIILDD